MHSESNWSVVAVLWGAFVLNYIDRQIVFSLFPVLTRDLHFSAVQLGSIGTVFTWVYSLSMPVAGRIADTVRRDRLIAASLVLWSIATYGTGTAASVPMFLFWRAVMGVTESLFMPAALGVIAAVHTGETRSRALSLFATGQFAGIIAGGALGGWMGDRMDWRKGFSILAVAGIGYGALLLAMRTHSSQLPSQAEAAPDPFSIFRSRTWLALCVAFFCYCAMLWILLAWLADFIHARYHLSLTASGVSATIFVQAGSAAGVILGGILGDRFAPRVPGGRFYVGALGLFSCAPFAWGLLAVNSIILLKVFSLLFGILGGLFVANLYASAYDVVAQRNHGIAAGAMNLIGGFAGGAAILLTGMLKDQFGVAWLIRWIAAGALVAATMLMIATAVFFRRDQARVASRNLE